VPFEQLSFTVQNWLSSHGLPSQSGSAQSARPSPSLSIPSVQFSGVSVGVLVGVWVEIVSVGVADGVCVCVLVDVAVAVRVGVPVAVSVGVWVEIGVAVAVRVPVGVDVSFGVVVAVRVNVVVEVAVTVGVGGGETTAKVALAVAGGALTADADTVFVKVVGDGGVALAFTVIVADWPIASVSMSTWRLVAVNVAVPAVVVTLVIVIQLGKSLSVTVMPRAPNVPLLVTVTVYVTFVVTPAAMLPGLTVFDDASVVAGVKGQLRLSLLKFPASALVANQSSDVVGSIPLLLSCVRGIAQSTK
jgi:hypothetical protein